MLGDPGNISGWCIRWQRAKDVVIIGIIEKFFFFLLMVQI